MGGGGYVAGPAGVAALWQRLPLVLTESDRHLGLANRLLTRPGLRASAWPSRSRAGRGVAIGSPAGPCPRRSCPADR